MRKVLVLVGPRGAAPFPNVTGGFRKTRRHGGVKPQQIKQHNLQGN